jgi:hypothetical protein
LKARVKFLGLVVADSSLQGILLGNAYKETLRKKSIDRNTEKVTFTRKHGERKD